VLANGTAKHQPVTHSIWVMVNHLAAWTEIVARRITERKVILEPNAGDFPPVTDASHAAWAWALDNLDCQHRKLPAVVVGQDAAAIDETVSGKTYTVAVMIHGTAQHFGYHAGPTALLKKLVG
jgi:hypothetical protein